MKPDHDHAIQQQQDDADAAMENEQDVSEPTPQLPLHDKVDRTHKDESDASVGIGGWMMTLRKFREQWLVLLFAIACIYYIKTVELPKRSNTTQTQSTTSFPYDKVVKQPPIKPTTLTKPISTDSSTLEFHSNYDSELQDLIQELNQQHVKEGPHSLQPLGASILYEQHSFDHGRGIEIRLQTNPSFLSTLPADLSFPSPHPLIDTLRRLGVSRRYITSGDPIADDPSNSFHQDHKFCAKHRKASRGPTGGGGSQRCRRAIYKNLEHVLRESPEIVWTLLSEVLLDQIENPLRPGTALSSMKLRKRGLIRVTVDDRPLV